MKAPNSLDFSRIEWHYTFTQRLASTMSTRYSFSKYAYYMVAIILIAEVEDAMGRHREEQLAFVGWVARGILQRSASFNYG